MKINKNKFLLLALSSTAFLSLVGSITGTVAWYQYSTRATAGIIGSSKAVTQNLQISTDGTNWKSDLSSADIYEAAKVKTGDENVGSEVSPLTSGNITKDAKLEKLYDNPVYQNFGDYSTWKNANTSYNKYLTFDLYFQFTKKVNTETTYSEKDVKLIDLTILGYKEDGTTVDEDLSKAMRVHFDNDGDKAYALASKNGGKTSTSGTLDLNGDGKNDSTARYEWETGTDGIYGEGTQTAYTSEDLLATTDSDGNLSSGVTLAKTTSTGASNKLTVTIWLEGWEQVNSSATWDKDTFSKGIFKVGMQFACDAD